MHVCKKRVIVDGKLAAFVGQLLSDEEAASLGLTKADEGKQEKGPAVAELRRQAKDLGITVPAKISATALKKLIAEAIEKAAENAPGGDGSASGAGADTGEGAGDGSAHEPSEDGDE